MADDPNAPWAERPRYLHRFTNKRSGREHVYFRKDGVRIALKSPWGTQACADEAAALLATYSARERPIVGTIVGAIDAYRRSADFGMLAARTQKDYERYLDGFEAIFAGVLLSDVDAAYVLALRDKWARRGYRTANLALQIFRNVCKPAIITGEIERDPFALIDNVSRPQALGETNPRWEDSEVEAVIEWAIERGLPGFANAVALGRWGGFRKQTIMALPRSARIVRPDAHGAPERRIYWVTQKRLVRCDRREDPHLTALLERTAKIRRRGKSANVAPLTIAFNARGEAFTSRAIGHQFERAIRALAEKGMVRPNLTPHGLRHARGVDLAAHGASDAEIMAQLDHTTPRAAAIYRRQAERMKLADAAQDRIDAQIVRLAEVRQKRDKNGA